MTRLAGIDISGTSVRGVLYDPGTHRLLGSEEVETARPPRDFSADSGLGEALATVRRRLRLGSAPLAVTADFDLVVTRTHLPFQDPKRIAEVVGFHIEERVPFDVTGWLVDYLVVRQQPAEAELLVFATPRGEAEDLLNTLLEVGIYPQLLLPRAMALFHAGAFTVGQANEALQAVIWVDPVRAEIVVGCDGSLLLARSIRLEENLRGSGRGDELARELAREVRRSLWSAGVTSGETDVLVGGEQFTGTDLAEGLGSEIGLPVRAFDSVLLLSREERSAEKAEGKYALALGAALALEAEPRVDLARSLRSLGLALRAVSRALTAFLVAVLVAGAVFLTFEVRRAWFTSRIVRGNRELLQQTWEALYPGQLMPPDPPLRVNSDLQALSDDLTSGERQARVDPLTLLLGVVQSLPADAELQVNAFRITGGEVALSCSARSLAAADRAVAALQTELKATAAAHNPMPLGDGRYTFEIRLQWENYGSETTVE